MAITLYAADIRPVTDGGNSAASSATMDATVFFSDLLANDYVVVLISAKTTAVTITNTTTGGQTWTAGTDSEGNGMSYRMFHCRFNGTWTANPVFSWTNSVPYVAWFLVFRGVDTTTAIDAAESIANFAAPSTPFDVTIGASTITTATNGAMVVAHWCSADDNTWAIQTAGWDNSLQSWRNAGGTDSSASVTFKIQATAGGNEAVTSRQTALGGDAGIRSIFALRPAPVTAPPAGRRTLALTGCGI